MITTKHDTNRALYAMNRDYSAGQSWRDNFLNISALEQSAENKLAYDYSQAMSDAYFASLGNKAAIYDSSIGQGGKQTLLEQNRQALMNAYEQYKQNYTDNLASISQTMNDYRGTVQSEIDYEADNMNKYSDYHYDYAAYLAENNPDIFNTHALGTLKFNTDGTLDRNEFMSTIYDKNGNITDEGKQILNALENVQAYGDITTFEDYLYNKDKELLEWASAASNTYGGNSPADMYKLMTGRAGNQNQADFRNKDFVQLLQAGDGGEFVDLNSTSINIPASYKDTDYLSDDAINALNNDEWATREDLSWTPDEFLSNANDISYSYRSGAYDQKDVGGAKNKYIEKFVDDIKSGKMKEGTIFDTRPGRGEDLYIYKDGKIYRLYNNKFHGVDGTLADTSYEQATNALNDLKTSYKINDEEFDFIMNAINNAQKGVYLSNDDYAKYLAIVTRTHGLRESGGGGQHGDFSGGGHGGGGSGGIR